MLGITSTKNPFPTKKMVSDPVVVETPVAAVDLVSAGDELDNAEALFAGLSPSV
jgi:hypothetical protein